MLRCIVVPHRRVSLLLQLMSKENDARAKALQRLKNKNRKGVSPKELVAQLRTGDINALAQCITLTESQLPENKPLAKEILELCMPYSGNAMRIGITGVPGVGKSSFLEAFGMYLIEHFEKRMAVLAIDPSSHGSGGSILGDKTRMEKLSMHPNAFIRPSPAGTYLGGVAGKTRESLLLCEAAGFDIVFIETVGVGQSETTVKNMVDFFLLLMLSGAGDELQGIKRGIMEMADALVVTKADGDNIKQAKRAATSYKSALHLMPPTHKGWTPWVGICSAHQSEGMDPIWKKIQDYFEATQSNGSLAQLRKSQNLNWFEQCIEQQLKEYLLGNPEGRSLYQKQHDRVLLEELLPHHAAQELLQHLFKH